MAAELGYRVAVNDQGVSVSKLVPLVAAIVVAQAVVASAHAAAPKDACGLLTKAEVVAALGEPLASIKGGRTATGAVFCNWFGKDSHLLSKGVTLIAASENVAQRYTSYASLLAKAKPLSGIGAAAVSDGTVVIARSSRRMIQIGPMYSGSGISFATTKALAKKALARG